MHMFIASDICQQQTVYPSQEGGAKGKDSWQDDREKSHVSIVRYRQRDKSLWQIYHSLLIYFVLCLNFYLLSCAYWVIACNTLITNEILKIYWTEQKIYKFH